MVAGNEAEVKVLEGVMKAGLGPIGFAQPATLQTLMAEFSVCSVGQSEDLKEKKKKISSKLSKRPRYRTKYSLLLLLSQLPHQLFLKKKIVSQILVSQIMMIHLPWLLPATQMMTLSLWTAQKKVVQITILF